MKYILSLILFLVISFQGYSQAGKMTFREKMNVLDSAEKDSTDFSTFDQFWDSLKLKTDSLVETDFVEDITLWTDISEKSKSDSISFSTPKQVYLRIPMTRGGDISMLDTLQNFKKRKQRELLFNYMEITTYIKENKSLPLNLIGNITSLYSFRGNFGQLNLIYEFKIHALDSIQIWNREEELKLNSEL